MLKVIITIFALVGVWLSHIRKGKQMQQGMTQVVAPSGRVFWVSSDPTRTRVATDLLDEVSTHMERLVRHISIDENKHPSTSALVSMFRAMGDRFELIENVRIGTSQPVALNYGKGAAIALCLFDSRGQAASPSALLSVAIHEMAHTMHVGHDDAQHTADFKDAEAYLMKTAVTMGMLPVGRGVGEYYCDIFIPDPSTAI